MNNSFGIEQRSERDRGRMNMACGQTMNSLMLT
jgi:hypothetical protein